MIPRKAEYALLFDCPLCKIGIFAEAPILNAGLAIEFHNRKTHLIGVDTVVSKKKRKPP